MGTCRAAAAAAASAAASREPSTDPAAAFRRRNRRASLHPDRPEATATLHLKLDSDAQLLGSESELHSIFSNVISNAVKYTPPDGRIDVRWWTDGSGGHVAVQDTGIGISSEHLPRLTERFYRVDPGRSRKQGGSGLGLAIVKHALQRHGAYLQIDSI